MEKPNSFLDNLKVKADEPNKKNEEIITEEEAEEEIKKFLDDLFGVSDEDE